MSDHTLRYGFQMGPATVTRLAMVNGHACIEIKGAREKICVRVTPSGLIRLDGDAIWAAKAGACLVNSSADDKREARIRGRESFSEARDGRVAFLLRRLDEARARRPW